MNSAGLKLVHLSPKVKALGGVESLLARHAELDPALGFDAWQLAFFDRQPGKPGESYSNQSFSWKSTPAGMRRLMARAMVPHAGSIAIWHGAWGLPWFADVDCSLRRIIYFHGNEENGRRWLPGLNGLVDGIICVNPDAARAASRLLPSLTSERIIALCLPITPPAGLVAPRPVRPEWVIGCGGRLTHPQKRAERIVPFVAELTRLGVRFRLEIMGDGPLRPWLKRQFEGNPAVRFLGWLEGPEYWRHLQAWDAAVVFSDAEGSSLMTLETMAAGALPIYPAIGGSLGDDYAARIDPRCLYPAGDPRAAARALRDLLASPPGILQELRRRAQGVTEPHKVSVYEADFAGFVRRVAELPRLSREPRGDRRALWWDYLPLGLLARVSPEISRATTAMPFSWPRANARK